MPLLIPTPSALSHSLFPAAVFDCHPTWSGKMPLLTPSSLSCHPTWSGKHHAAAYVLQGHATSIRPRSGNSRSPTTTPPPQKQNRNPHRLNIPDDSPSLPSQSPETLSQRGFRGRNPCDSTNGQEQLSRTRSRGGSLLKGFVGLAVSYPLGLFTLGQYYPLWGYQGLAAMPPGLRTPGQNRRSLSGICVGKAHVPQVV